MRRTQKGVTLVELMVALVIGAITVLAIQQVMAMFEGQKRASTGGADAQVNGAIALFTLEREIRQAGYGLFTGEGSLERIGRIEGQVGLRLDGDGQAGANIRRHARSLPEQGLRGAVQSPPGINPVPPRRFDRVPAGTGGQRMIRQQCLQFFDLPPGLSECRRELLEQRFGRSLRLRQLHGLASDPLAQPALAGDRLDDAGLVCPDTLATLGQPGMKDGLGADDRQDHYQGGPHQPVWTDPPQGERVA